MKLLLAGQPNSGKSSIFNAVVGYRSATANFPGTSVTYTLTRALIQGQEVEVVDLPGIYSLASTDSRDSDPLQLLLERDYDLIINVVDAGRLGRSLELTLQLLELERPMVIALNMVDEAQRKGLEIDAEGLEKELGVPVIPTIGQRGRGLRRLFRTALAQARAGALGTLPRYDREVEAAVDAIVTALDRQQVSTEVPHRFIAAKLLEGEAYLTQKTLEQAPGLTQELAQVTRELEEAHGWSADQVVSGNRHAVAHAIEDRFTIIHSPHLGLRERIDRFLLHPLSGGPIMVLILAGLFYVVFDLGQLVEQPLINFFENLTSSMAGSFAPGSLIRTLIEGVIMGVSGGVAIILPYLIPFLLGLAILEDTGYLPRMAYILDSFMHRLGLHGKSVLPLIIGYGCAVPAVMAARILESRRDRRLTVALIAFVPCSARTIVIYGLVAAFMGPLWALLIYLLNIVVVVIIGVIFARTVSGRSPGLILEIPDLSLPVPKTMLAKTWLSLKEFIVIAWPVLIVTSAVLAVLEWAGADRFLNTALSPLTVTLLGLPVTVGVTLVFGVLRKELTLVMLVQALGTADIGSVMTDAQMLTFTLFVVFYVPCLATIAAMTREVGWKDTAWISALTVAVATFVALAGRLLGTVLG
jgi:ferrous iron transport protein B